MFGLKKKLKANKKGFTLAELLIVVAIIGVLVAVAVPMFAGSLDNARNAVVQANTRSALAEATVDFLEDGTLDTITYNYPGDNNVYTASIVSDAVTITATPAPPAAT